jgi:hypothetical protein
VSIFLLRRAQVRLGAAVCSAALLALFALSSFGWGKAWFPTEIDAFVRVSFPMEPERVAIEGQQLLRSLTPRAGFMAVSRPIPAGLRSDTPQEITGMFNGMVKGILKAAEGEMLTTRDLTLGAALGRQISYRAADKPGGLPTVRHKRLVVYKHRLYVFDCWLFQAENARTEADREQFFASISVRELAAEASK